MMTVRKELVIQKISQAEEQLIRARGILAMSDKEILEDDVKLSALERYFQLTVDSILGANNHIIKETELKLADDLQSTFLILSNDPGNNFSAISLLIIQSPSTIHRRSSWWQ